MSVNSTAGATVSGAIQAFSAQKFGPDKSLFSPIFGVVEAAQERLAAKLDANQDGGVDLQELNALGGLGSGKNGPASFAALDSNGDQKLNLRELQSSKIFSPQVLNTLLGQQAGNGLSEWLVTEGDADGDGALTMSEFRTVGPATVVSRTGETIDRADTAFKAADTDGDGQVTATELAQVAQDYVRRLWPGHNAGAVAADLMNRDADASGGLSKTEVAKATSGDQKAVDAMFETADTDLDGELTLAELQAQIAAKPDYYRLGITKLEGPLLSTPFDPRDPAAMAKLREYVAAATPPPGEAALLRMFRENVVRLTDELLAGVGVTASKTV